MTKYEVTEEIVEEKKCAQDLPRYQNYSNPLSLLESCLSELLYIKHIYKAIKQHNKIQHQIS